MSLYTEVGRSGRGDKAQTHSADHDRDTKEIKANLLKCSAMLTHSLNCRWPQGKALSADVSIDPYRAKTLPTYPNNGHHEEMR